MAESLRVSREVLKMGGREAQGDGPMACQGNEAVTQR
jgi:hypothetical protein